MLLLDVKVLVCTHLQDATRPERTAFFDSAVRRTARHDGFVGAVEWGASA